MTRLFFYLFFFFLSINLIAQDLIVVDYTHSLKMENAPRRTTVNSRLISNNIVSSYEMFFSDPELFLEEEDFNNKVTLSVRSRNNPIIYKIIDDNKVFSEQRIFSKKYLVEDILIFSDWKIENVKKTILSYECQKASIVHRGRNYEVFFTLDLPYNQGPWKFHNLPGLILEVKSTDGVFEILANKIEISKRKLNIKNPYEANLDNSITWAQFIEKYKKKYNDLLAYRDENNGFISIPKRGIETYIED